MILSSIKAKIIGCRKSVTVWFNGVVAVVMTSLPMLQESIPQLQAYIAQDIFKYMMGVVIVANILLRFKTTKSLSDK